MLQRIEMAKVGVHYASLGVRRRRTRPGVRGRDGEVVHGRSCANYVTAECIQIHGGVGYTWVRRPRLPAARQGERPAPGNADGNERVADLYFAGL